MIASSIIHLLLPLICISTDPIITPITEGSKCKIGCGNYLQFSEAQTEIVVPNVKTVFVQRIIYPEKITVKLLTRRKYATIVTKDFGSKPIFSEEKSLHPYEEEAREWVRKNMCRIGTLCKLNGDCWKGDAEKCRSDNTWDWVKSRLYQYKSRQWDTSLYDACTMDWECSIESINFNVFPDNTGSPLINLNKDWRIIYFDNTDHYQRGTMGTITYGPLKKPKTETISVNCFDNDNELMCEDDSKKGKFRYFTIAKEQNCGSWGSISYCINRKQIIKDSTTNINIAATISDIKELAQTISYYSKVDMKNTYIFNKEILELKRAINSLVLNLMPSNPNILSFESSKPTYSRKINSKVFEMCPCGPAMHCSHKESHYEGLTFCADNITARNYSIFKNKDRLTFINGTADFQFRGVDINPIIEHLEQEYMQDRKNELKSMDDNVSFVTSVYEFPFHIIFKWSGPVSLCILIFQRLRA